MASTNGQRKESEVQAAEGRPDPELESLVAPQGYEPELVDDVATMETPTQQRRKAIRFGIVMLILIAIGFWFCTPANLIVPEFPETPFGIHDRPLPPQDKFLDDAVPKTVGDFRLVDLRQEQVFEDPYVGAVAVQATYVDSNGQPVTVVLIEAESYINARRYLENYKRLLNERTTLAEFEEKLYIDENFIQWAAPEFADRAYGLAWNNERYFIAVTSPISEAQRTLAADFPY
jgi:hypothetical protein